MGEKRIYLKLIPKYIILNKKLPSILTVKNYDIKFDKYSILLWHPVTSQINSLESDTRKENFCKSLNSNYVVIYPNDPGSSKILNVYNSLKQKNLNYSEV